MSTFGDPSQSAPFLRVFRFVQRRLLKINRLLGSFGYRAGHAAATGKSVDLQQDDFGFGRAS